MHPVSDVVSEPEPEDVVTTYNTRESLGLSAAEIKDLAEYLKSI